jgi:hypothetical protein
MALEYSAVTLDKRGVEIPVISARMRTWALHRTALKIADVTVGLAKEIVAGICL